MGSFFGAELCDLIGLYALNHLKSLYKNDDIGLYRDNSLEIIERKNNQSLENIKKKTIRLLKKYMTKKFYILQTELLLRICN